MLIALMTILFLGGGAGSGSLDHLAEVRDVVKEVVPLGEHRDAALETLKLMKKNLKARNKVLREHVDREQWQAVFARVEP